MHSILGIITVLLVLCESRCEISVSKTLGANNSTKILPETKIIGGTLADSASSRYQISLRLKAGERLGYGEGHICGGSVISQRTMLTAAHCIMNTVISPSVRRTAKEFTVVMGTLQLFQRTSNTLQYDVSQIVVHSGFSIMTLANDIAMISIEGRIPDGHPSVQIIPLPNSLVEDGTFCRVTGWGKTEKGGISAVLLTATVPVVNRKSCEESYAVIGEKLRSGMICAGYTSIGGFDACQGDSGGPLASDRDLVGIVSWGEGCGQPGYPGIYTDVFKYRRWISVINETLYNGANGLVYSKFAIGLIILWMFVNSY